VSRAFALILVFAVALALAVAALMRASLFAPTRARRVLARVSVVLLVVTIGLGSAAVWWYVSHWQFEY
jgi:hypothetical protein